MAMDGEMFMHQKGGPGQEEAQKLMAGLIAMRRLLAGDDPTMTTEMIQNRAAQVDSELAGLGNTIPPAFVWYYQYGYRERWNNPGNNDPSMKRTLHGHEQSVQGPCVAQPPLVSLEGSGLTWPKLEAPHAYGLVGDRDAPLGQEILNVP